jgi:hypothetical protein
MMMLLLAQGAGLSVAMAAAWGFQKRATPGMPKLPEGKAYRVARRCMTGTHASRSRFAGRVDRCGAGAVAGALLTAAGSGAASERF